MGSKDKTSSARRPFNSGGVRVSGPRERAAKSRPILLPYQQRWMNDRARKKIWLAARQIGKSFALSMEAVAEGLERKCNNLVLSASERQSREVIQKVYSHLRVLKVYSDEIIRAESASKEEVQLPNGSRIISLPANPDTVRGFSGNVFLDEFAFHKDSEAIWRAMYPTVTRGYKVRISSTANGKNNMFYRLWSEGDFSRHETSIYEAKACGLELDIEAMRGGIADPDAWAQEYECRFIDEATAFITYEMIQACEDENATKEFFTLSQPSPLKGEGSNPASPPLGGGDKGEGEFYLGMDIARKGDLTILWLWQKVGDVFWTRMVREMRNTPFSVQRDFLYGLLDGKDRAQQAAPLRIDSQPSYVGANLGTPAVSIRRCCIDSTGIGAQMAEEAAEKFGPVVEAVTFTAKTKEDLAITLRRKFEDRQVRIPADRDIREDIHSVKKFTTSAGNIRFDAERTELGHADRFWA
nr:terminase family protein [Nitrospiraceae bacterium]